MAIKSEDIVPLNQVSASFTELAEEVRAGAEKVITRNGESYVALVVHGGWSTITTSSASTSPFALLPEALSGIEDERDGRVATARQVLAKYEVRRKR